MQASVLKDLRALTEDFVPQEMLHRDGQLLAIRDCLKPVLEAGKARNAFLYGEPGTGKTSMSRYVLEELEKYSGSVLTAYVNCWVYPSRFKVYYSIIEAFGKALSVHRKGTPTDELYDLLERLAQKQPCIIVMDEVDQLEDDKVVYDLLQAGFGLLLISNSSTALFDFDSRVRSRLAGVDQIEFPKYKDSEVAGILKARAGYALVPGSVKRVQLERIAGLANGDARAAIAMLKSAAELAESQDSEKILDSHIQGMGARKPARPEDSLNQHQRLLYEAVKAGSSGPGEVYAAYEKACKAKGIEPLVERTLRKYLDKLVRYRLLAVEGEGRWRVFSPKDS